MTEFKVGDKVQAFKTTNGEITYGPVGSTFGRYTVYVVRKENGEEVTHRASDLTPLTAFAVGDVVTLTARGARATVEYGPFDNTNRRGPDVYVVKLVDPPADDNPRTFTALAREMEKVADDTYTSRTGITYSLAAKYKDRMGYVWAFTGLHSPDGAPRVTAHGNRQNTDTIARIEESFGPLREVADEPADGGWIYNGVTYVPGVDYIDNDGDPWRFALVDGELRGDYRQSRFRITVDSYGIDYAVSTFGPFNHS